MLFQTHSHRGVWHYGVEHIVAKGGWSSSHPESPQLLNELLFYQIVDLQGHWYVAVITSFFMSHLSRHLNLSHIMLKSMPSQKPISVSSLVHFNCPPCSDGKARTPEHTI